MEVQTKNPFLKKDNIKNIYNQINNKVQSRVSLNIDTDKKYKKIVKQLALRIINSNDNYKKTIIDLNKIAISKISDYIVNSINKNHNENGSLNVSNKQQNITPMNNDNYGILSYNDEPTMSIDDLYNNTILTNGMDSINDTTDLDFKNKLEEIEKARGYDNFIKNSNDFRKELKNAENLQKNTLKKLHSKRTNNEFLQNLDTYENIEDDKLLVKKSNNNEDEEEEDLDSIYKNDNTINNNLNKPNEFYFKSNDTENLLKTITLKQRDFSKDNQIDDYDPNVNLKDLMPAVGENAIFQPRLYENTQRGTERILNKILLIDTGSGNHVNNNITNLGTNKWYKFRVDFDDTIILNKLTDVYLESFSIYGQTPSENCMFFTLDIEEFNIQTYSNNNYLRNKFSFPNNTKSEFIDTTVTVAVAASVGDTTLTVAGGSALVFLHTYDNLYCFNNEYIGSISTITDATHIVLAKGIQHDLRVGDKIYLGHSHHQVERYDLNSNYICTLNPMKISTLTITITNENNEHVDSTNGYNNVFKEANSNKNRIMFELLLSTRGEVVDFNK